jgi:hypothetical protein
MVKTSAPAGMHVGDGALDVISVDAAVLAVAHVPRVRGRPHRRAPCASSVSAFWMQSPCAAAPRTLTDGNSRSLTRRVTTQLPGAIY